MFSINFQVCPFIDFILTYLNTTKWENFLHILGPGLLLKIFQNIGLIQMSVVHFKLNIQNQVT